MRAAILAVGSELLGADRLDTNSLKLAALLATYGVELGRKSVVGDSIEAIGDEVAFLVPRHDLVIVCGGLGPTADDVTREGVAVALGLGLTRDPELEAALLARFAAFVRRMPEVNRKQADRLAGATVLPNPRGTAPGQRVESGRCTLFLLPGVPTEQEGLVRDHLAPWLAERCGTVASETRTLRVACMPESEVDERLRPLYERVDRERITVLCSPGEVRVLIQATGVAEERHAELDRLLGEARTLLGAAVFSDRDEVAFEAVVGELLVARGATVAVAESCTGGLLCERFTRIAGASAYLLGGVVAYDNSLKRDLLGVPEELFATYGAVSEPVARRMAESVRERTGASYGIALTGVAGPGGGTEAKPVGTVHLALAGSAPEPFCEHRVVRFPGDRERVRWLASQLGLEMLRRRLVSTGMSARARESAGSS